MKRDTSDFRIRRRSVATPEELEGFQEGRCCTAKKFKLDLNGTAANKWNKSATEVFTDSFLECKQYQWKQRSKISAAFRSHLRGLIKKYREQLSRPTPEAILATKLQHSRQQRKQNKFQRRLASCLDYDQLRPHQHLIRILGPNGMSSDEPDSTPGQFRVLRKPWRQSQLTRFLSVFDAAHERSRAPPGQPVTRGALPGRRVASDSIDGQRPAVKRLPINAYDPHWYGQLSSIEKEELRVDSRPYNFSIESNFLR
ncbi:uncharacterized protein B0H18DRAFT_882807 [Fomitopsis serialis]|uniref:uncharacterized protein n=1 Tax=Fomitopsis serialis TaxID=139415 RepID=UPI0020076898|nr:uncharacterized protein B0H18DRAFT_882807 [Neoantrodia serialis]KAH9918419.1 hypothetical protein B0H18DRAFT_882807 [Neoantrodia serialis]